MKWIAMKVYGGSGAHALDALILVKVGSNFFKARD